MPTRQPLPQGSIGGSLEVRRTTRHSSSPLSPSPSVRGDGLNDFHFPNSNNASAFLSASGRHSNSSNINNNNSSTSNVLSRPASPQRRPTPDQASPGRAISPRVLASSELLPARPDSSIGATSSNPRVRKISILDVAAAQNLVRNAKASINFTAPESVTALKVLRRLLCPLIMKALLRRRRNQAWAGVYPPRLYTMESVTAAIHASKSLFASWPEDLIELFAQEAIFQYYKKGEIVVYNRESHLSSGLVVLLHGQLTEQRPSEGKASGRNSDDSKGHDSSDRPIHTQKSRTRFAPDVVCNMSVLCEDRTMNRFTASEQVDIAVIPSRWIWEVINSYVLESPLAESVLESIRFSVLPQRAEMVTSTYYATSVVLQRSWMWAFLSGSDRVKLARAMETKVLCFGDVLYEEGTVCPYIYFVRRGTLTVVVKGEPLRVVEPGAAFGEVSVLFNDPRNSTVIAGSVCELYALHRRDLNHRMAKHPELARLITLKGLERRQRWMEEGRVREVFSLVSLLGGVPCLSHTTDAMREEIALTARVVALPAGHYTVRAGTACDTLYVIGRGSVRLGGDGSSSNAGLTFTGSAVSTVMGEVRSAGDFFGELCLHPHLWPLNVVTETSVDAWAVTRDDIVEVLRGHSAHEQALDICQQGIKLYRTQRGEGSIIEGDGVVPNTPTRGGGDAKATVSHTTSLTFSPMPIMQIDVAKAVALAKQDADALKELDWTNYMRAKAQEAAADEAEEEKRSSRGLTTVKSQPRELRQVDKDVEKAMRPKVQTFISIPPSTVPSSADCDFPGEVEELQAIIVEQLLLTPSEEQPRFLHQVNNSNVKLVTEGNEVTFTPYNTVIEVADLAGEEIFVPIGVSKLEEIGSINSDGDCSAEDGHLLSDGLAGSGFMHSIGRRRSEDASNAYTQNSRTFISRSLLMRPPSGLPSASSPRTTTSQAGGGGIANNSFSAAVVPSPLSDLRSPRTAAVRPGSSAVRPSTPRVSLSRPMSSSEQLAGSVGNSHKMRPASVDLSQHNKVTPEKSNAMLDRYVKIEDQDYFKSLTKVLPLHQEMWNPDEDGGIIAGVGDAQVQDAAEASGPFVLLLMHVRACACMDPAVLQQVEQPILRVSVGTRTLLITPPLPFKEKVRWPIEVASFVRFVSRNATLTFAICDGKATSHDNAPVAANDGVAAAAVYTCELSMDHVDHNSGVGQLVLKFSRLTSVDTTASSRSGGSKRAPRLVLTLLVVTASKYETLNKQLRGESPSTVATTSRSSCSPGTFARGESDANLRIVGNRAVMGDALSEVGGESEGKCEEDKSEEDGDGSSIFLQVLTIEELKHRVEASVTIRVRKIESSHAENGAEDSAHEVALQTPRISPKTRTPAWTATGCAVQLAGDGYARFELRHKETVVGFCEVFLDDLIFAGPGTRLLPLAPPNDSGDVMGLLRVAVLSTHLQGKTEEKFKRSVMFFHAESLSITQDSGHAAPHSAMPPDPFVVLRNSDGNVLLKTPLLYGTFQGQWSAQEASCFVPCPALSGSVAAYHLELYDSDESLLIGRTTLTVTGAGLGPGTRFDVPMDPLGHIMVRVTAHCLPVITQCDPQDPRAARSKAHFGRGDPLVLLHLRACHDLPGGKADIFRTDAVATVVLGATGTAPAAAAHGKGDVVLRTPACRGTTAPQWARNVASVLLQVRPQDSQLRAVFNVFDGIVDEADHLGGTTMSFGELCTTSSHTLALTAPPVEASREIGRNVGLIEVDTYCGHEGAQVLLPGTAVFTEEQLHIARAAVEKDTKTSVMTGAICRSDGGSGGGAASQIRVGLTTLCSLFSFSPVAAVAGQDALQPLRNIRVTLSTHEGIILETKLENVDTPYAVLEPTQACQVISTRSVGAGNPIRVLVEVSEVGNTKQANAKKQSSAEEETGHWYTGVAEITARMLASVKADGTCVYALPLSPVSAASSGSSTSKTVGRPPTPMGRNSTSVMNGEGRLLTDGRPVLSVYLSGITGK